jgi:hypothetical protein
MKSHIVFFIATCLWIVELCELGFYLVNGHEKAERIWIRKEYTLGEKVGSYEFNRHMIATLLTFFGCTIVCIYILFIQ